MGEEFWCGESDRVADQFGSDRPGLAGLEVDDPHAEALELLPGVDVCRVIVEVGHDLVARRPIESVRDEAEPETGRTEEGEFVRPPPKRRAAAPRIRSMRFRKTSP